MNEYIVGMDIGSSEICTAVGKVDRQGKLQIVGISSVECNGIKKGIVVDIDETSDAIKQCIDQLNRMIDTNITSVYVSLSGGICELIPSRGVIAISSEDKEISSKHVNRVLNEARITSIPINKEIVGVIPKSFTVNEYENIKDPIGMVGVRLEVDAYVVLAQSTIVNNLMKSVNKAGLEVNGIVLEPLAIAKIALRKDETNMVTAIVDVGAQKIDITIYKDGYILHTDVIPYGGDTITNDISICLKIPFSEAEKLKIKYGSVQKLKGITENNIKVNSAYNEFVDVEYSTLIDIIEARTDELLKLVKIKLYESGYLNVVNGIILVGGGVALLNGAADLAKKIFDKPVKICFPEYVGASSPIYTTAVGIIKDVLSTSNLRNEQVTAKTTSHINVNQQNYNEEKQDIENKGVFSKIRGFLSDFF